MRLKQGSRRWTVLNYAVSEPNQWTCRGIADDLSDNFHGITEAALFLVRNGLVVKGEQVGRSRVLIPTPAGVETLYRGMDAAVRV
jgi:hypothetical protein